MNYNLANFTQEQVRKLNNEIDLTIDWQEETLELAIAILLSCNGHSQRAHHDVFLNILAKIRLNLETCIQILPMLKTDYRFKVSSNLLYRAILDDIINIYYLYGFVLTNDNEQNSLNNELSILHKEFVKSSEAIIKAEAGFKDYLENLFKNEGIKPKKSDPPSAIDKLRKANPEIYNNREKRWKTAMEIRANSHPLFNGRFPDDKGFISESQKIKFIKSSGFQRPDALSYLFKFFSQFQHFSPKMHSAMLVSNEYDVTCYQVTLMELTNCMAIILPILNLNKQDLLNSKLHTLLENIVTKEGNHGK